MSYIQSEEHFKNYLAKAARDGGVDNKELFPPGFYIEHIYGTSRMDEYTWKVKQDASWLRREKVREFLSTPETYEFPWPYGWDTTKVTMAFENLITDLEGVSGVYIFETNTGDTLYAGRSFTSLGNRVAQSFNAHFQNYNEQVFVKCHPCNPADAAILEMYLITSLKPLFNRDSMCEELPTIKIENTPKSTISIPCFHLEEKSDE